MKRGQHAVRAGLWRFAPQLRRPIPTGSMPRVAQCRVQLGAGVRREEGLHKGQQLRGLDAVKGAQVSLLSDLRPVPAASDRSSMRTWGSREGGSGRVLCKTKQFLNWPVANITAKLGRSPTPPPFNQSFPNSPNVSHAFPLPTLS